MGLYRCTHCTPPRTFEADRPVCEVCNLDPKKNPRHAGFIDALLIIHFDPPSNVRGIGLNAAACNPKKKVGQLGSGPTAERLTGEKAAVTCPACKATAAFTGETPAEKAPMPAAMPIGSLEAAKQLAGVK